MMGQQQGEEPSGNLECDFYMYLFKVQPCPKRGAHDWSSCPYAHPKEKARRRDPRVYKYASTPCPESLQGVNCGRGVECPYAHSVYEYWLHPGRFRTQMCKKGNQCNRTLCFFAHSASELRFPDTGDDAEAAAVDAAAASASATPLPLCHAVSGGSSGSPGSNGLLVIPPACGSSASSLPLVPLGSLCSSDTSSMLAGGAGSGSFSLVQATMAGGSIRQGSCASQLTAPMDDLSGSLQGGSEPGMLIPGYSLQQQQQGGLGGAMQQQQQQLHHAHQQQQQHSACSLSEPLPRLGSDPGGAGAFGAGSSTAAWLQLAAASQLPASQIMSSIRPPPAASLAAQQQAQLLRSPATAYGGGGGGHPRAMMHAGQAAVPDPGLMFMSSGGSGSSTGPLVTMQPQHADSSAEHLAASLAGITLQGYGVADNDNSASSCVTSVSVVGAHPSRPPEHAGQQVYAAQGMLVHGQPLAGTCSQPLPAAAGAPGHGTSSRSDDFLLLQMLQEKQMQQHQQQQHHALAAAQLGANRSGGMMQGGATSAPSQAGNAHGWCMRLH